MKNRLEIFLHLLFWVFILLLINIDWTVDWFDQTLRPNTPAPLSLIMFAIYFYLNAFFLIPTYFSTDSWGKYLLFGAISFLLPELLRILLYSFFLTENGFVDELFSRDSFIFGAPSALFLAFIPSFVYRLLIDRMSNNKRIKELEEAVAPKQKANPYQGQILLTEEAAVDLELAVTHQLENEELYLDPAFSLRKLATVVNSTEKKVSYLINQRMDTSFFELLNSYRVKKFITEVEKPENSKLSMTGIALNCGFPSKSSFYRAFKSHTGMSPSAFLKSNKHMDADK